MRVQVQIFLSLIRTLHLFNSHFALGEIISQLDPKSIFSFAALVFYNYYVWSVLFPSIIVVDRDCEYWTRVILPRYMIQIYSHIDLVKMGHIEHYFELRILFDESVTLC